MDRRSLIISVGLHVSVGVLAWIGLPSIKRDLPDEQPIVVMEMVQSVPTTNLTEGDKPNTAKKEQKAAKSKKPPPPPPPAPPRAKPPAPKPVAKPAPKAPDPKAEILPQKVTPKPKPKPAIAQPPAPPKPKPKTTATLKAPKRLPQSPPKRINKLARHKALQKQRKDALSGVMQNLAKAKADTGDKFTATSAGVSGYLFALFCLFVLYVGFGATYSVKVTTVLAKLPIHVGREN